MTVGKLKEWLTANADDEMQVYKLVNGDPRDARPTIEEMTVYGSGPFEIKWHPSGQTSIADIPTKKHTAVLL